MARAARRVVGYLTDAGYEVHVVHPLVEPGTATRVDVSQEEGFTLHLLRCPDDGPQYVAALRRMLLWLHVDLGFSLFHGFWLTMAHHVAVIANRLEGLSPRPVISSMRGSDAVSMIGYPYWRQEIRRGLEKSTWLTSVNGFCLERIRTELGIQTPGSVIYNGVPACDSRWRLDDSNRGGVGCAGQFRLFKDVPLLLRAYSRLEDSLRRRLVLIGAFDDDAAEEEWWSRQLIAELGIKDEVEVTGHVSQHDVYEKLLGLNVYVQPSAYEGLPNALLEAAARGVPLVATAVGGMAEVIEHGETGLLVPHGNPHALAAALQRVLAEPRLANRLSQGALRLAARLSERNERTQWLELYEALLARNRSSNSASASRVLR